MASEAGSSPNLDVDTLPQDIKDKLAELELELSEGKLGILLSIYLPNKLVQFYLF